MYYPKRLTGTVAAVLLILLALAGLSSADEYIIGPEDVLKISFWQDPELDQVVAVRQDGKITLSIIGEINAAGLTSRELSERIESNVSLYHKKISQAAVTVVGFNSQKVFVSGQVKEPGKKTFEVIPDLWTVIKEAGGATETGDLTRVMIIRSGNNGGERITVNLLEAISSGDIENLPKLKVGDTVEIPKMAGGVPGRQLAIDYSQRKNLYYVLGRVRTPGTLVYEEGIDIFDAIGAAGGTTEFADLKKVRIISKIGDGSSVMKINLNKYQTDGQARRIIIKPEDTIIIGEKGRSLVSWSLLRDVAAVAGTIISFAYLIDRR
jgi:polysaccharide export outer membrane protein